MGVGQNIHCYWSVRCEFALVQKCHNIAKSHMNVTGGTRGEGGGASGTVFSPNLPVLWYSIGEFKLIH